MIAIKIQKNFRIDPPLITVFKVTNRFYYIFFNVSGQPAIREKLWTALHGFIGFALDMFLDANADAVLQLVPQIALDQLGAQLP